MIVVATVVAVVVATVVGGEVKVQLFVEPRRLCDRVARETPG